MNKKHGPWIIKKREQKYKNPWLQVNEDQVVRPDGKSGIYGTVVMKDGVSILAMDNQQNVYLIKEFHYALGINSVEVVSGAIDGKEKPLAAAKRELKEESGIIAKKWISLGRVDPFTSAIKSAAYLFIAKDLAFGEHELEGCEDLEVVRMPFAKAIQMVTDSKITHGPSCVLILKAKRYLDNKR